MDAVKITEIAEIAHEKYKAGRSLREAQGLFMR